MHPITKVNFLSCSVRLTIPVDRFLPTGTEKKESACLWSQGSDTSKVPFYILSRSYFSLPVCVCRGRKQGRVYSIYLGEFVFLTAIHLSVSVSYIYYVRVCTSSTRTYGTDLRNEQPESWNPRYHITCHSSYSTAASQDDRAIPHHDPALQGDHMLLPFLIFAYDFLPPPSSTSRIPTCS